MDSEMILLEKLLIEDLGMPSLDARILIFLLEKKRVTSKDLCNRFGIQQPVASLTTKKLINQGLISSDKVKLTEGRGRRANVYYLNGRPIAVFNRFLKKKVEKVRLQETAIAKTLLELRRLT